MNVNELSFDELYYHLIITLKNTSCVLIKICGLTFNFRDANNTHYSKGNITFSLLAAEPVRRPGMDDFYGTPKLKEFVRASKVRIRMQDHQLVTNLRHEYFGVYEFIVDGRLVFVSDVVIWTLLKRFTLGRISLFHLNM